MKYKLIYDSKCGDVVNNNLKNGFEYINSNNKLEKIYYKIGKDKVEIVKLDMENTNLEEFKTINEYRTLIIVDEINNKNIEIIKELYKNEKIIFLSLKDDLKINHSIILKEKYSKIGIDLILLCLINNFDAIKYTKQLYLSFGNETSKSLGKLSLKILQKLRDIDKYKNIYLNLYLNKEYNLQELTYIEDPLREYMNSDSRLIIKQIIDKDLNDEIYFTVLIGY